MGAAIKIAGGFTYGSVTPTMSTYDNSGGLDFVSSTVTPISGPSSVIY